MFLNAKSSVRLLKHTIKSFKHEEVIEPQEFEFQEFSEFSEFSSQNHIIQKLPSNCLEEIFESMDNDRNALFSCALVNRHWCRLSIPLLWRRPFEYGYPKNFGCKLIKIYINFLTIEERELLKAQDILVPNNSHHNSNGGSSSSNNRKLLFEYPKYIQCFDVNNFIYAIKLWILIKNKAYEMNKFEQKIHLLARLLGNLFCKYSNGFKLINYQNNNDIKFTDIKSYNGIGSILYKLNEFKYQSYNVADEYHSSPWIDLFNYLTEYTYNIQHLSIHIYKNNRNEYPDIDNAVIKLIQGQKNLKTLSLSNFWKNSSVFYSSIREHNNSLTYLRFEGLSDVALLVKLLSSCRNLHTLDLIQSSKGEMEDYYFDQSNLPNDLKLTIKNFYYNFNNSHDGALIYLLKLMNWNLKLFSSTFFIISHSILIALKNYNPNITHLSLIISKDSLDYFDKLLKNIPLKYLFLDASKYQNSLSLHHIELLSESLPTSLIYLDINFKITSKQFESLLSKSNHSKINTIAFHNLFENHTEYLEIMVNHVINNVNSSLREIRFQKDFLNRDCDDDVNFQRWLDDELKYVIDNYNNNDLSEEESNILKEFKISEIKPYHHNFNSYWY